MNKDESIVSKVLAMDDEQLAKFLSNLDVSAMEYLEVILDKAEKRAEQAEDK